MTTAPAGFLLQPQLFSIDELELQLLVPDETVVRTAYEKGEIAFPFWSRVWPSSVALANFIVQHPYLVQSKTIIELGAGLGLPSLVAAGYAKQVTCTEISPDAVSAAQASATLNGITNFSVEIADWQRGLSLKADVLLLSDVNYEPAVFESLNAIIQQFISDGGTVLLTTPQRLMAKDFVAPLRSACVLQKSATIGGAAITIMVLKNDCS